MDSFYKNLSEGKAKSEALRNAKLLYLEGVDNLRSHPYYWAHFTMNGNDTPLVKSGISSAYWFLVLLPVAIVLFMRSRKRSAA
jgi:hypothetical protein